MVGPFISYALIYMSCPADRFLLMVKFILKNDSHLLFQVLYSSSWVIEFSYGSSLFYKLSRKIILQLLQHLNVHKVRDEKTKTIKICKFANLKNIHMAMLLAVDSIYIHSSNWSYCWERLFMKQRWSRYDTIKHHLRRGTR